MNQNLTEIIFLIDKSGSMAHLVADTIGGFNSFVKDQRECEGEAKLTTVLFSTGEPTTLHDRLDIQEVEDITKKEYRVGGGTALLDAIGDTITHVQERIDETTEDSRPGNVVFVVTTDGEENSSVHYSKDQIKKMVDHQSSGHGWNFIFLGANMDAIKEADSIGIGYAATYVPNGIGTQSVYNATSMVTKKVRSGGAGGQSVSTMDSMQSFYDEEYQSGLNKASNEQ